MSLRKDIILSFLSLVPKNGEEAVYLVSRPLTPRPIEAIYVKFYTFRCTVSQHHNHCSTCSKQAKTLPAQNQRKILSQHDPKSLFLTYVSKLKDHACPQKSTHRECRVLIGSHHGEMSFLQWADRLSSRWPTKPARWWRDFVLCARFLACLQFLIIHLQVTLHPLSTINPQIVGLILHAMQ